jgi:hypothetical protein
MGSHSIEKNQCMQNVWFYVVNSPLSKDQKITEIIEAQSAAAAAHIDKKQEVSIVRQQGCGQVPIGC